MESTELAAEACFLLSLFVHFLVAAQSSVGRALAVLVRLPVSASPFEIL